MGKHLLAVCVLLCTVGVGIAQEKPNEQKKPEQAPTVAAKIQTGQVASIDAAKNEIVIKDEAGAEIHLLVGESTKITRAGKAASFGDLKVGDKVATECEESTDGCKAKTIAVIPPAENK